MPDIIVLLVAAVSFLYGGCTYLYSDRKARKSYRKGLSDGRLMRSKQIS